MRGRFKSGLAASALILGLSCCCVLAGLESGGTNAAIARPEAGAPKEGEFKGGGITITIGMAKDAILKAMEKTPASKWYAEDLDSPPQPELLKMDSWTLSYADASSPTGRGAVKLTFADDKVTKIAPRTN